MCLSAIANSPIKGTSNFGVFPNVTHVITRVMVANRGEIARRVFATCRRLGIGTVAVYTDPDALPACRRGRRPGAPGGPQRVSGRRATDRRGARRGADAIHPGYGFLSENAEFAAAVHDAGLTWVGPPVAAVAAMGSKIEAKKMMAAAGCRCSTNSTPTPSPPISCRC